MEAWDNVVFFSAVCLGLVWGCATGNSVYDVTDTTGYGRRFDGVGALDAGVGTVYDRVPININTLYTAVGVDENSRIYL